MKSFCALLGLVGLMCSTPLAQTFKGVVPTQGLIFPQIVVGGTSESEINRNYSGQWLTGFTG